MPNKAEIQSQISQLTMAKTARATGILDDDPDAAQMPTAAKAAAKRKPQADDAAPPDLATVAGLEQALAADPTQIDHYLTLAELQAKQDDLKNAEATLRRALAASGNENRVREELENIQIRRAKGQLNEAESQARAAPSEAASQLVHKLKQDMNRLELAVFTSRVERYPDQLAYQYELAVRLKRAGSYAEAAKHFEAVLAEAAYQAAAALQQGECLQQLRKYQEAQSRYLQARKWAKQSHKRDLLKLSLYRAGILAGGLKSWDQARALFEELIAIEPSYRDARARLDKLQAIEDT